MNSITEEDFSGTEINLSENLSDGEQQEAIPETPDSNTEDSEDQGEITVDPEETPEEDPQTEEQNTECNCWCRNSSYFSQKRKFHCSHRQNKGFL